MTPKRARKLSIPELRRVTGAVRAATQETFRASTALRDGVRCRVPGCTTPTDDVDAHHIEPLREACRRVAEASGQGLDVGDPESFPALVRLCLSDPGSSAANGIPLCRLHHGLAEAGGIDRDDLRRWQSKRTPSALRPRQLEIVVRDGARSAEILNHIDTDALARAAAADVRPGDIVRLADAVEPPFRGMLAEVERRSGDGEAWVLDFPQKMYVRGSRGSYYFPFPATAFRLVTPGDGVYRRRLRPSSRRGAA